MTGPIVFISRNRVKPGMLEDFKQHYATSLPATEASKPGTLVQLAYVNEAGTEVEIVRVFPNAEALDQRYRAPTNAPRQPTSTSSQPVS